MAEATAPTGGPLRNWSGTYSYRAAELISLAALEGEIEIDEDAGMVSRYDPAGVFRNPFLARTIVR
jgi:hypothetical protein